jgi:hypothetical protein
MGQDERLVEPALTYRGRGFPCSSDALVERKDVVKPRVQFPQRDEAWLDEHRDVRGRVGHTESLQGRHAHHAVADPIDPADENPSAVI